MYQNISKQMLLFIEKNKTAFHTVDTVKQILLQNGFEELAECNKWNIEQGKSYFVTRNLSSIIAFKVGEKVSDFNFQIASVHTDSPCFKVKENAEIHVNDAYTKLNTEGYGGMIRYSWLDRPLSIAGRVLVKGSDGEICSKLLDIDRDLMMIPSVAVHMNRDMNKGLELNMQTDMLPLLSECLDEQLLLQKIAEELSVEKEQIIGSDLYVYCRDKASVWGLHNEYISSPRLDDQQCVFASLQGLLNGGNENTISMLACFDNEEVGSGTKQGAASTFLFDVTKRVSDALGKSEDDYYRAIAASFMLSADNAHAVHPNHPELTDANNNVYMNKGVVVKSHAGQKYTSDGMSIAVVRELAGKADVPLQFFSNRSDKAGGSTLGNLAMAQVSMNCVDIGLAQLAMHSAVETAGIRDTAYMISLMEAFYNSQIVQLKDGNVRIAF